MTCSVSEVFADWLDVTYAPVAFPKWEICQFLQSVHGWCQADREDGSQAWRVGQGVLVIQERSRWCRVSASGAVIENLRSIGAWEDYLAVLAEEPLTVTRLDVAVDMERDGADVVAEMMERYPVECALSRKAQRVKTIREPRAWDDRQTGTWYVGHRAKGEVTARVYDKANEAWDKRSEVLPPTARFEVTVKKGFGPTLRDAARPAAIFWHFAAPALLERPAGVVDWEAGWGVGWEWKPPESLPAAVLKRRVESSPEIGALIALADAVGVSGRELLLSVLANRIKAA